jgi:hypothetical protein
MKLKATPSPMTTKGLPMNTSSSAAHDVNGLATHIPQNTVFHTLKAANSDRHANGILKQIAIYRLMKKTEETKR